MQELRVGKISAINYEEGKARVVYDDKDGMVTPELPFLSPGGIYDMPAVGDMVLVAHLPNGPAAGVIIGKFFNINNVPVKFGEHQYVQKMCDDPLTMVQEKDGVMEIDAAELKFMDMNGSVSLKQIIDHLKG